MYTSLWIGISMIMYFWVIIWHLRFCSAYFFDDLDNPLFNFFLSIHSSMHNWWHSVSSSTSCPDTQSDVPILSLPNESYTFKYISFSHFQDNLPIPVFTPFQSDSIQPCSKVNNEMLHTYSWCELIGIKDPITSSLSKKKNILKGIKVLSSSSSSPPKSENCRWDKLTSKCQLTSLLPWLAFFRSGVITCTIPI